MTDKKYDGGKVDMELLFLQFPLALQAIPWAAMYGSVKYDDTSGQSYKRVTNGARRYASAQARHKLKRVSEGTYDKESHVAHRVHEVWNALAGLEFALMGGLSVIDPEWRDSYEADWKKQGEALRNNIDMEADKYANAIIADAVNNWPTNPMEPLVVTDKEPCCDGCAKTCTTPRTCLLHGCIGICGGCDAKDT